MKPGELLYDLFMLPLESGSLKKARRELLTGARGDVLEIGPGTGSNLPVYPVRNISTLTLLDCRIRDSLRKKAAGFPVQVRMVEGSVESLPFGDGSFDTVVFTLVFCSVGDPQKGLGELVRVLRPGGRILYMEHVRPEGKSGLLADRLSPAWCRVSGGCNLNRRTGDLLRRTGLTIHREVRFGRGFFIRGEAALTAEEVEG